MSPRKVSQVELKRLKKKGKVRRKMGAQPEKEQPVPATTSGKGMSGSEPTEAPAPAPIPQPKKPAVQKEPMASMSASMQLRDNLLQDLVTRNTKAIADFGERLANMKPQELSKWHQADFIRHKVIRANKTSLIDHVDSIPMKSNS